MLGAGVLFQDEGQGRVSERGSRLHFEMGVEAGIGTRVRVEYQNRGRVGVGFKI